MNKLIAFGMLIVGVSASSLVGVYPKTGWPIEWLLFGLRVLFMLLAVLSFYCLLKVTKE